MKIATLIKSLIIIVIIIVNANCKKEFPSDNADNSQPPPVSSINTAPVANAGQDKMIFIPVNSCQLIGSVSDDENNIITIHWENISGPQTFLIENPDSLVATLSNLNIGVYQFELAVKDAGGLTAKDTISVTVYSDHLVLMENLSWVFPWYPTVVVSNFNSLVPPHSPFTVYIKRDANPIWIRVDSISNSSTALYEYFIETRPYGAGMYTYGSLYIFYYGNDYIDTPDIKIVY